MTDTIRLNLGCGLTAPLGWVNIDRSPSLTLDRMPGVKFMLGTIGVLRPEHLVSWPRNIKRMDVTKPLPYRDGSVGAIYSSHMLEHLYHDQATALLAECKRVLLRGGVIRLALPDAHEIARRLLRVSDGHPAGTAAIDFTRSLNMGPLNKPTRKQRFVSLFASSPHRWQPTTGLVIEMMRDAGFADPQPREFMAGDLPGLADVEHRAQSLFVEAAA
jgi:SAM-dependent methyltransferase